MHTNVHHIIGLGLATLVASTGFPLTLAF